MEGKVKIEMHNCKENAFLLSYDYYMHPLEQPQRSLLELTQNQNTWSADFLLFWSLTPMFPLCLIKRSK